MEGPQLVDRWLRAHQCNVVGKTDTGLGHVASMHGLRPRPFRAFTKINPRPIPRLIPRPAAQFRVAAFAAPRYAGGESALNLQPALVVAAPR